MAYNETWIYYCDSYFDGGTGTESDPYQIATAEQLANFARWLNMGEANQGTYLEYCSKYYVLTSDIDLSGHYWNPIGNSSKSRFSGHFDGRNHKIFNMTVRYEPNTTTFWDVSTYLGLFGYLYGASVKNVTLINPLIYTGETTEGCGFLAGYAYGGNNNIEGITIDFNDNTKGKIIYNATVAPTVKRFYGGLVGYCYGTNISDIYIPHMITINTNPNNSTKYKDTKIDNALGGICGYYNYGYSANNAIVNVIVSVEISAKYFDDYIGGIFGYGSGSTPSGSIVPLLQDCSIIDFKVSNRYSSANSGGLFGCFSNNKITISNCCINQYIDSGAKNYASIIGKIYNNQYPNEIGCLVYDTNRTPYDYGLFTNNSKTLDNVYAEPFDSINYQCRNQALEPTENISFLSHVLGDNWGVLDGNLVPYTNQFKLANPDLIPLMYRVINIYDGDDVYYLTDADGVDINDFFLICQKGGNITIPATNNTYISTEMSTQTYDTGRFDGNLSTEEYAIFHPYDTIYNIEEDYYMSTYTGNSYDGIFHQNEGYLDWVEEINVKTTEGTLVTVNGYIYQKQ